MTEWNWSDERRAAIGDVANQSLEYAAERLLESRKRAFEAERTVQSLQSEIDAPRAAHAWVKTSERMPDNDARKVLVIICGKGSKRVELADYYCAQWSIGDEGYGLEEYETVTHWQPLPEPPK